MGARNLSLSDKKDKKLREALNNIYKRNYSWLLFQTEKLPHELKKEIQNFRKKHNKIRKENPKNSIDTPHTTNTELLTELDRLTEKICEHWGINPEGLRHSLMFYILHDRIEPPAANFFIVEENGLVSTHYFRQPTNDDFYLESVFVKTRFKNKPINQTIQFDPRLFRTILRKRQNAASKSTWEKVDKQEKEEKIKVDNDTQKRNLSKQDKHRYAKHFNKLP